MTTACRRSIVQFDEPLHADLRSEVAHRHRSLSDQVNEAVRVSLAEDQEDLSAFDGGVAEPTMPLAALLDDLKAHGE